MRARDRKRSRPQSGRRPAAPPRRPRPIHRQEARHRRHRPPVSRSGAGARRAAVAASAAGPGRPARPHVDARRLRRIRRQPAPNRSHEHRRTEPRALHRHRQPPHRPPRERPSEVRRQAAHLAAAREGEDRLQARLRGLEPLPRVQARVPRVRVRAHRHPAAPHDREELRRHPDGRRRDGPRLEQGAHHDVRDRLRRLGLLAPRLEAQGEQQAGPRDSASRGRRRSS